MITGTIRKVPPSRDQTFAWDGCWRPLISNPRSEEDSEWFAAGCPGNIGSLLVADGGDFTEFTVGDL